MCGVTSRNGYGSDENSGADDSFTDTFGYFASTADSAIAARIVLFRMVSDEMPMWSMMRMSWGWRSAMRPNSDVWPVVRNMMGMPAFSAAGQNQSADPSVSHAACSPAMFNRMPSTAGCSLHVGSRRASLGSLSAM